MWVCARFSSFSGTVSGALWVLVAERPVGTVVLTAQRLSEEPGDPGTGQVTRMEGPGMLS